MRHINLSHETILANNNCQEREKKAFKHEPINLQRSQSCSFASRFVRMFEYTKDFVEIGG